MTKQLGYYEIKKEITTRILCVLTIGSIIKFNGQKCIVTHTTSYHRIYDHSRKWSIDITKGFAGYLKNIETNKEFRADWSTVKDKDILYFETFN
jgi:hypothetical protein